MAKFYLHGIFVIICVLIGLNSIFAVSIYNMPVWAIISAVLSSVTMVIIIDTFFAIFIGLLPKQLFGVKNKCFYVSKKEQLFYDKLSIRKWKDYVWELGGLGGFSKRKILCKEDPKYFKKFIIESHRGIVEHILGSIFGFGVIFMHPRYMWSIGLPIAIVNVILNLLPTMILRYNLPKLKSVYFKLEKRQQAKK